MVAGAPGSNGVLGESRSLQWSHPPTSLDWSVRLDLERAADFPLDAAEDQAPSILISRLSCRALEEERRAVSS